MTPRAPLRAVDRRAAADSGTAPDRPMIGMRRRLALVHFGVVVLVMGLAGSAAWWGLAREVRGQLDAALLALADTETGMLASEPGATIRVHEALRGGPAPLSFARLDRLVQIIDPSGAPIARSANLGSAQLPVHPATLARLARGDTVFETVLDFGDEPIRLVSVAAPGGAGWHGVQVAGSLDDVDTVLRTAAACIALLGLALLVATGAAGALLLRRAFDAIGEVVDKARRIGGNQFDERLPHPGGDDEIGRLVDTLNEMLTRLARSFDAQRRFTADASHELRSPLSRLRTELELALRRPRDTAVYVETIRSSLEEAERLSLLVDELLALARLDAGQEAAFGPRRPLAELVDEAVARMTPVARDREVRLELALDADAAPIAVAPGFGTLVLDNLLDNAIKFSPPGEVVGVRLGAAAGAHGVALEVADRGPGVPDGERERVFERFYRGSLARPGSTPGMGIGLALARAGVEAHGGRLVVAARPGGGARFEAWLPSGPA